MADGVLEEKGFDDKAEVELCTEYYPMRIYEGVSLPAGEYISLKVIIGSGKGKNWWCVLFPPLCLNSARATEALCGVGISEETAKMLTSGRNRYKIKFWIVDKLGELCERKKCK
ncbi:hypothetical protein SDC9_89297 [bioreactor metagenome]|uniref:Stage II sporulation protein R n=1 Tax=bioreactor metagenome TaxID=1076179 RepID=A0A644ZNW2_9ZZZZ